VVITLVILPKVCGLKPGLGRRIFKGDKNPNHDFIRRGSEAIPAGYDTYFAGKINGLFSQSFSLLRYEVSLLVCARQLWWMN
jgi:hypothetical protein